MLVERSTDEQLWSSVPARADIFSHRDLISYVFRSQLSSEAEVTDLEDPVTTEEHVLGLEIAMDDIVRVHKVASLEHLPNDLLRFKWLNARVVVPPLQLVQDRPVKLLEDKEDAVVFAEDLEQVDDMIVLELLQNADLPQRRLADLSFRTNIPIRLHMRLALTYSSSSLSLNFLMAT